MGFLDKLSSAASSMKKSAEQALDKVREATDSGTETAQSNQARTGSDDFFLDATQPESWITPVDVAALVGTAVDGPERCDTPETDAIRFTGDGVTVEVHSVRESVIGALDGDPRRWIEPRAASYPHRREVPGFADYAVVASDDAGRAACLVWCGDTCFVAEVGAPDRDPAVIAEAVLRKVYDWPA